MATMRALKEAIARTKEDVGSLLKLLIVFYGIALGIAGLVGIVWFLIWIFTALF